MHTITLKTHVGPDGVMHLDIPVQMFDADLDVTLQYGPAAEVKRASRRMEATSGSAELDSGAMDEILDEEHRHTIYDT